MHKREMQVEEEREGKSMSVGLSKEVCVEEVCESMESSNSSNGSKDGNSSKDGNGSKDGNSIRDSNSSKDCNSSNSSKDSYSIRDSKDDKESFKDNTKQIPRNLMRDSIRDSENPSLYLSKTVFTDNKNGCYNTKYYEHLTSFEKSIAKILVTLSGSFREKRSKSVTEIRGYGRVEGYRGIKGSEGYRGVSDMEYDYRGVSKRGSGLEGVSNMEYDYRGVSKRGSGLEGVSDMDSNYRGVSNIDSKYRGVSNMDSNYRGVSNTTDKQQGVNNSNDKQHPFNNSTSNQQGVGYRMTNYCNYRGVNRQRSGSVNYSINNYKDYKGVSDKSISYLSKSEWEDKMFYSKSDKWDIDMKGGINNKDKGYKGVKDSDYKGYKDSDKDGLSDGYKDKEYNLEGVSYKDGCIDTQHPFSNSTSKQQGVNNNDTYKDTYANTQHPFSNSTSKQQGVNNNDTYKDTYANTQHPFSNSTSKQQGVNNNDTYKDTYANTQHPFISTGNQQSYNGRRSSWVGVEDKRGVNYIRRGSMYMDRCYEPSNSKISNNSNISNTISVLEDTKSCTSVDTPLCSESDILPIITKGPWSEEEDNKLLLLIKKYKPKNWSFIAKMMKTRVGKQCRERWHNHLNPDIKKGPFSLQEEEVIMHYHKKIGNRWSEISKKLPGRTDNSIKNHYNSSLRRSIIRVLEYSSSGVKGMVIVVVIRVLEYSSSGVKGMVIVGLEGVSYIGIIKGMVEGSSYKGVSYIGSSYIGSIKGMVDNVKGMVEGSSCVKGMVIVGLEGVSKSIDDYKGCYGI
ncbi:hypothetical protein CWI37_1649p0010 [Hamiltosporidium tvaerminnensis]|uniref:Myb-like DNA-binding domain-containing protein n=1 Tax=Hamiltosporidium tvaerminnensis TaxID=1176355 RepID=A0A4Q9KV00_9MICR|nr:hypothetical protein CWI37_1649p0010 [Hamiltosporidium tvaerminnensis]